MDLGHTPIPVEDWKGMYTRGVTDTAPAGYFLDSLNVRFSESDVFTREGSVLSLTQGSIVRFFLYKRLGEATRVIYLDALGQLYDSLYPSTPIWTDVSFTDFSLVNFNNRAYITPHNRVVGIPGKYVLVYDGSGSARLAGGSAPAGFSLTATNSATSGNCEEGKHLVGVCFLSSSGFITAPGPEIFAQVDCTGGFKIDIAGAPIGPTGTIGRVFVATKAIQDYNGNQYGYQFYIVGSGNGGLIPDNSTTTGHLSFFDSELQITADYLFNNRGLIPAGVGIGAYKGRMLLWGINGDEHSVYVSKVADPEQMDGISGFVTVDPFESTAAIRNCFEFRGILVICKPNRMYVTQDNDSDPSTWKVDSADQGTGTECFGVATILDSRAQQNDLAFLADRSGFIIYQGYVRRPEGSWLVEDTWKRINKAVFNLIQCLVDPTTSSFYISLPLDGSTTINYILYGYFGSAYGDYGFDPKGIKWSLWQFQPGTRSITMDVDAVTGSSVLKYAGSAGNIYDVKLGQTNDNDVAYASFVQTALYVGKPGYINHFAYFNLRLLGNGFLTVSVQGEDNSQVGTVPTITMNTSPGKEYARPMNFQNERCSLKFSTGANAGEYFKISRMDLYVKSLWLMRPS